MNPSNYHALLMGLVFKMLLINSWATELKLSSFPFTNGGQQMDCPELGLNIGDACDDGMDQTQNDIVQSNCKCLGIDTIDEDLDMDGFTKELDCDDNNPNINPNIQEIPDNGIDEDCSGEDLTQAEDPDIDNDGATLGDGDCDDSNPNVYPGAPEILGNGIDENCNGIVDDITSALTENRLKNSFTIFPNPTSDYLEIDFKVPLREAFRIQILDMLGKIIYQQEVYEFNELIKIIDTTGYNTGFYTLSVIQSGQRASKKFVCLK